MHQTRLGLQHGCGLGISHWLLDRHFYHDTILAISQTQLRMRSQMAACQDGWPAKRPVYDASVVDALPDLRREDTQSFCFFKDAATSAAAGLLSVP